MERAPAAGGSIPGAAAYNPGESLADLFGALIRRMAHQRREVRGLAPKRALHHTYDIPLSAPHTKLLTSALAHVRGATSPPAALRR